VKADRVSLQLNLQGLIAGKLGTRGKPYQPSPGLIAVIIDLHAHMEVWFKLLQV
jgi:hypothetical protein